MAAPAIARGGGRKQFRKVQRAVGVDQHLQICSVEAHFFERPGPVHDRADLGVDSEQTETRDRRTVSFRECKAGHLHGQRERIE